MLDGAGHPESALLMIAIFRVDPVSPRIIRPGSYERAYKKNIELSAGATNRLTQSI